MDQAMNRDSPPLHIRRNVSSHHLQPYHYISQHADEDMSSDPSPSRPPGGSPATFVNKLYSMVEDEKNRKLISWSGVDIFCVHNPTEFSRTILPQYFKHNNWQSFVRQLNMYGFHKVNDVFHSNPNTENTWEFKHPKFQRGRPDMLRFIRRKTRSSSPLYRHPSTGTTMPNINPSKSFSNAGSESAESAEEQVLRQMADLKSELTAAVWKCDRLWTENTAIQTMYSKQQQILTATLKLLEEVSKASGLMKFVDEAKLLQQELVQMETQLPSGALRPLASSAHERRATASPETSIARAPASHALIGNQHRSSDQESPFFLTRHSAFSYTPDKSPRPSITSEWSAPPALPTPHPQPLVLRYVSPEPVDAMSNGATNYSYTTGSKPIDNLPTPMSSLDPSPPNFALPSTSVSSPEIPAGGNNSLSLGRNSHLLNPTSSPDGLHQPPSHPHPASMPPEVTTSAVFGESQASRGKEPGLLQKHRRTSF
ncbi:uncharacterized protein VTP21DRAFT_2496 [Calcarisporiella thermophila]|uniref:uncharacterized protein n=1 Tax=Calcarisporiella thermophila TaxID=911321 RepID=UPI0037449ADC